MFFNWCIALFAFISWCKGIVLSYYYRELFEISSLLYDLLTKSHYMIAVYFCVIGNFIVTLQQSNSDRGFRL